MLKKNQKGFSIVEALIVLVILGIVGFIGYRVWHKSSNNGSNNHTVLADAKPQYAGAQLTAGYLTFNSAKFQPVSQLSQQVNLLKPVYEANSSINSVVFEGNVLGFGNSGLYLYDIAHNTAYKIASGGSSAARIMSNHYVVYGYGQQNSSGTNNSIIVLNLQTGVKQTIVEGNATQLTGNDCCAVSPDGLELAIPEKNKILVWNAQNNITQSIPAQLDPFSANFPTNKSFYQNSPYFVEMNYPTLAWLNDSTIVYANHPPTTMDSNGNTSPTNNQLYLLNLSDQTSKPLQNINDGLYNVAVANNGQSIFADNATSIYQFDPQTLSGKLLTSSGGAFNMYSPDGSKIFIFQSLYSPNADFSIDVTDPTTQIPLNVVPPGLNQAQISQVIPESWISNHQMLLKITATNSVQNHEWEGVYDTTTNKVTEYIQVR